MLVATIRLASGSDSSTQTAGSSAASQASGTGGVSAVAATVRVSAGCGPGSGVIRSVNAHRTTVPGLHPANEREQNASAAVSLRVFMGPPGWSLSDHRLR